MKKILVACGAALFSMAAVAQEEQEASAPPPAAAAPSAWSALDGRWYLSPMLSYVLADHDRQTDNGFGGTFTMGRPLSEALALEGFATYDRFDHDRGGGTAKLIGGGVNGLLFPAAKSSAYLLVGAGYGTVRSQPGADKDYGTALIQLGPGYWWAPFDLLFKGVSVRTQLLFRLDAHNDRRTGDGERNGRKAFDDFVFDVGLTIPLGSVPAPPPADAPPVEVVAVAAPADADGDGVTDDLDQCPDTPAGASVDEKGCPAAAPAKACKSPAAGEKIDLSGCGTGDVIVLEGVNFEFNRDRLTANARTILDGVGEALKAAPATNVEIGGHTDAKGTDAYNQRLSERRACAVTRYLAEQGTADGRLTPVGYGESKAVADNETDEGRERNRRVELKILDGPGSGSARCGSGRSVPTAPAPAPGVEPAQPAAEPEPAAAAEPGAFASEPAAAGTEPAALASEPAAAATEPAAAASEPAPRPEPSVAPESPPSEPTAALAPPVASGTAQLVPQSEVFGDAGAAKPAPMQQVPENQVFEGRQAPKGDPAGRMEQVPASQVFENKP